MTSGCSTTGHRESEMGQTRLDVKREKESGHDIVELPEARFWQLCGE